MLFENIICKACFLRELKLDSRQLIHTLDSLQKIVKGVNVN